MMDEVTSEEQAKLELAMTALNIAFQKLSELGYELPEKIEFKKKSCKV